MRWSSTTGICHGQLERTMKHIGQSASHERFDLRAISCDLDLAVGVPRVAKTPGPVEGQPICRHPFDPEGFTKSLGPSGTACLIAFSGDIASIIVGILLVFLLFNLHVRFPEDGAPCRVVNDSSIRCRSRGGSWYRQRQIGGTGFGNLLSGLVVNVGRRLIVNGGFHPRIPKVFTGFIGGKYQVHVLGSLKFDQHLMHR